MSILRTYGREPGIFDDPELGSQWPLYRLNDDLTVNKDLREFAPGDWACHVNGGGTGRGIVVAVNDDEIAVLWSTCPQEAKLSNVAFPTVRKGVMTRYGKKMVRSDFYGTVTILDMNII